MTAADRLQNDVAAGLARDVDANFERMVTTYRDRVFAFTLNLTADRHEAEEIAQETFVSAYRALCGYAPARRRSLSMRAWLFTIALNRVRNRTRSKTARRLVPLDAANELPAGARERPEAVAERRAASSELRSALARLPLKVRSVVVLRHIDGYSYDAIAALLGRPAGTVKSDVHRGLARLRADLETRNA
ncbi:MAG: RNA polymerase sigma factor [Candidatus Eremiobacteraeota bacterium]|nr:RNA polymerase sigma factor [Candidatus Eremiobacteraeota bacterium]